MVGVRTQEIRYSYYYRFASARPVRHACDSE